MADHDRLARALQIVARGVGRINRERARSGEVTPQQAETLQVISDKGGVSTSSLATILGIDPSTASRNLAGLERAGFISRKKGTDDGRQTDVRLTPRGKRAADSSSASAAEGLAVLLERVARADRQKVADALDILVRATEGHLPA